MNTIKRFLPDVLAIIFFAALSFAYFFPADIENRILYQHDSAAGRGLSRDVGEFKKATGETSRWSNTVFGGMPTYQTAPSYDSMEPMNYMVKAYTLGLPDYVVYLFIYLFGFYILLRAFDFRQSLAALGSIIWAFSSYFLIIIAAGHYWKVMALAYLPPLIAGLVLAYRGKYLWGLIVTAIFTALEIKSNHVQMTYYYLFVIGFIVVAWFIESLVKKNMKHFWKAAGVALVGVLLGVSMNISNLYHTWEYSKHTMRGKSELVKPDSGNQTSSGLDRDYITAWSYGIGETWTLLVPNTKGGASVPLSENETAMKHANSRYNSIYNQIGQYWGEQPMTSGPVYVGAFVLLLAMLGLFIVKGGIKWALLAATVLSILLSWGHNFMWFTDLFIDYMPMYAKFRTVSSILVIAEFTIPLLAMLALKKIVDEPELMKKKMPYVYVSLALTGGVALLFAIMPDLFFGNYISTSEMHQLSGLPAEHLNPLMASLTEMRRAMFTSDCWRSVIVIALGMACLLLYKSKAIKAPVMIGAILVICLVDMWQINKRYLNDGMFVEKTVRERPMPKGATEDFILQDKDPNFRVLNLATNTFNENNTSYYFKSIGGYHAAKLRRYQEMIEYHIAPEMRGVVGAISQSGGNLAVANGDSIYPVLNMLNAKYFIVPLQDNKTVPVQNPHTYGNGWFVDKVNYAANANEEMDMVGKLPLRHEAVADKEFEAVLGQSAVQDSTSSVKLTAYAPNRLQYEVNSAKGGVIVFSEIYYPGWTATVDGEDVEVGRVNYILRAINVKPGTHKVELVFKPTSIDVTESIAYAAYVVLLLVIIGIIIAGYRKKKITQE